MASRKAAKKKKPVAHTKNRIERTAKKSAKRVTSQKRDTARSTTKPLTAKQQTFVAEYLANGFNATQAAIAAGYSKKTADSIACRLLKMPPVAAAIDAGKQERLEKLEITSDRVLSEIGKVAFADKPYLRLSDAGYQFEVKTKDKLKALELLGKNQKLFTEKVEHSGSVAIAWVAELSDEELEAQLKTRGVQVGPAKSG